MSSRTKFLKKLKEASTPESQKLVQAIKNKLQSKEDAVAEKLLGLATGGNCLAIRTILDVTRIPPPEPEPEQKESTASDRVTVLECDPEFEELNEQNADSFPRREPE